MQDIDNAVPETRILGPVAPGRRALLTPLWAARGIILLIGLSGIYFFHGFLVPVLAALVIGFASWPLYRKLLGALDGRRTLAASIMLAAIVTFIVTPVVVAIVYAVAEVRDIVAWAVEANRIGAPVPAWFAEQPFVGSWLVEFWEDRVGQPGAIAELLRATGGSNINGIYNGILAASGGALNLLLALLFMLVTLLFVYRDGIAFAGHVDRFGERIFPGRWNRISRIVPATISSTVTGMTLIAIGEGIVLGIAYWIAGAPSPVTLGIITGIAAMIPGGAPLSFTLVSVYLVASGSPVAGVALLVWGSVELFIVDKTLRPKLVGGPIKLPFLPTFFGLVGGVKTMGFVGLFLGPVLMALLVSIWRESVREIETPEVVREEAVAEKAVTSTPVQAPVEPAGRHPARLKVEPVMKPPG